MSTTYLMGTPWTHVARVYGERTAAARRRAEATATEIAFRCNVHDELVKALRDLREASTVAYQRGGVDALAFVTAGNVLARAESGKESE